MELGDFYVAGIRDMAVILGRPEYLERLGFKEIRQ
jgi:hypothetical protein